MSAADWKLKLTPTTAEIDAARAQSPAKGLALQLQRTAMAALFTLAEEGFAADARGSTTDGEYLPHAARQAVIATWDEPPLSRAALAAGLLSSVVAFFEHIDSDGEPDHVRHYEIMLVVGYHAGMLSLDELGLFDIAAKAQAARKGRGDAARARNLARAAWHSDAQSKARHIRQKFPTRSAAQVADLVHNDPSIDSPSYQQTYDLVLAWEKDGTIPRKK